MSKVIQFCEEKLRLDRARIVVSSQTIGLKFSEQWTKAIYGIEELVEGNRPSTILRLEPLRDPIRVLIKKERQVGASTAMCALQLALSILKPKYRSIHLSPTLNISNTIAKHTLRPMIYDAERGTECRRDGTLKSCIEEQLDWCPGGNSLTSQVFKNQSRISMESIGKQAEKLRGRTADLLIFDEYTFMSEYAMSVASHIVTNGVLIFVGDFGCENIFGKMDASFEITSLI